jgi:hypothetical protein
MSNVNWSASVGFVRIIHLPLGEITPEGQEQGIVSG